MKEKTIYGDYSLDVNNNQYNYYHVKGRLTLLNYQDLLAECKIQTCSSDVWLVDCRKLYNLSGIGKYYINQVSGKIYLPDTIHSNILGLILVKDLKKTGIDIPSKPSNYGISTPFHPLSPTHAKVGDMYYDTVLNVIMIFDGKVWQTTNPTNATIEEPAVPKQLYDALKIINKHLLSERDILDCQEDLITAGLKEYAKL